MDNHFEDSLQQKHGFICGRRNILAFFGFKAWRTIIRWKQECGLPLYRLPSGRPYIIEGVIVRWLEETGIEIMRLEKAEREEKKK